MRVGAIYIAPVKSLALQRVGHARVTKRGLEGDREFFLIDARDRLITMRECGSLATVRAEYLHDLNLLRFEFPDGPAYEAAPLSGEPFTALFFGQYQVEAHRAPGPWDEALSQIAGQPLFLARASGPRSSVDVAPVSLLSDASLAALRDASGEPAFEERRFRPNVFIEAAERAHVEDEWVGGTARVGAVELNVKMRDSRCVMTTLNPDSGRQDVDTLKLIAAYRTDQPKEVNFGVYCTVRQEGTIAVGDEVIA
jgi:uncharacterized protein YcbX